jgi:hypothetical protein
MVWLLLGYMFLFIHRPFEVWPWLGELHFERLYMLGTLLAFAAWPGKKWLPNRQHLAYAAFALSVLVAWLASPWGASGDRIVEDYFKIVVFYILLVLVVHDERNLKRLLFGFLTIMALYLTHSLREYVNGRHVFTMGIARLIAVDTTMGDPNSFGNTIVYVLPFVVPFWIDPESRNRRWFLAGYVALSLICIGLTGSRSSLVGFLLGCSLIILRSRYRLSMAMLAVMLTPLLWAALPSSLQTRFETIVDPSVGPANARTSSQGRIDGLINGVKLWETSPFTGCGPGAWRPATGSHIESHNLYGQLIGELGTLGALAFASILLAFWLNLRWIRRVYRDHPEWGQDFLYRVTQAIGLGVLLMLFLGNFSHNLYRYNWLWFGGFLIIIRHCIQERLNHEYVADVLVDRHELELDDYPLRRREALASRRFPVQYRD